MPDYDLGTARGKIEIDSSGATTGVANANKAVAGFGGGLEKAGSTLVKTGAIMGGIGVAAIAGFGLAINSAANFEQRISAIGAVSNATEGDLDSLRKLALKLGADTKFSAGEAAKAIEEIAKAGVPIPDILNGAAKAVTDLAAAGEVDLTRAAEITANSMNAFSIAGKDASRVADVFATAANASAADVETLGQSMSQVSAVASLVGLSFEDTVASLELFANKGLKGSDAGTSLKTMLLNLQPQTLKQKALFAELGLTVDDGTSKLAKMTGQVLTQADLLGSLAKASQKVRDEFKQKGIEVDKTGKSFVDANGKTLDFAKVQDILVNKSQLSSKGMKELGIEVATGSNVFFDAQGKLKPMIEIQKELQRATMGMTDAQKLATLEQVGGTDAVRAFGIITQDTEGQLGGLRGGLDKQGSAAETAKKRMDNLKGSIEQFKGSVETAMIRIGQLGQGPVKAVVDFLTGLVNKFLMLPGPVIQFLIVGGLLLGLLVGIGGGFILASGLVLKFITAFRDMKAAILVLKEMELVQKAVTAAQWLWNAAMSANPLFLVIAAVVILVAALVFLLVKTGALGDIWNWIKGVASDVWGFIVGLFNLVKRNWDILLAVLLPGVGTLILIWRRWGDTIKEVIGNVIGFFQELPGKILGVFKDAGSWLFNVGKDIIQGLINGVKALAGAIVDTVKNVILAPLKLVPAFLRSGSPSRLFVDHGEDTVNGFQLGLRSLSALELPPITQGAFKIAGPSIRARGGDGSSAMVLAGTGANMGSQTFNAPLVTAEFTFGPGSNGDDLRKAWNDDIKAELAGTLEAVLTGAMTRTGSR